MGIISVFDLDKTLLRENSCRLFLTVLYRRKVISTKTYYYSVFWYLIFRIFGLSVRQLYQLLFKKFILGQPIESLQKEARLFYRHQMLWNTTVMQHLRKSQREGHDIWVMTASPYFLAQHFVQALHVPLCATEFYIDAQAMITGIMHIMDGPAKACKLQELLTKKVYHEVRVYSDDVDDLPLLELATKAYVVNPSKRLRAIAEQRRWEVLG